MSGGPTLIEKLAHIKQMPTLLAATVASEKPIDGFLIKDIVKMSYESSGTRVFLQQYLVNMLITSTNVYVKMKVLQLLQAMVDDGHYEFKQSLRKQPAPFNEAAKLRPHKVDDSKLVSDCGRIRDMANRLLDSIFADTPELQERSRENSEYLQRQLLNEDGGSHDGGGGSVGSRITGFGNTSSSGGSRGPSTTDKLKSMFARGVGGVSPSASKTSSGTIVYDPGYATMEPVPHNSGTNAPFTPQINSMTQSYASSNRFVEGPLPTGSEHVTGRAGGGWDEVRQPSSTYRSISPQPNPAPPRYQEPEEEEEVDVGEGRDSELLASLKHSQTEQERLLVEDITAPGGVRAAPPRDSLNIFINRCKSLDCLAIVEYLREKLKSAQSQVVLRTLFVMEALMRSDVPDILSFLDLALDELVSLSESTQSSTKSKATKILRQLMADGMPTSSAPSTSSSTAPPTHSSKTGNILDLGEGEREEPGNGQQAEETEPQEPSESQGIFSGLSVLGDLPSPGGQPTRAARRSPRGATKPAAQKPARPSHRHRAEGPSGEEQGSVGVLLEDIGTHVEDTPPQPAPREEPPVEEPSLGQEDDSLMDCGEDDEEFDPLKRTSSFTRSSSFARSGSLSGQRGALVPVAAQPQSQPSGDVISQLAGISLSSGGGPVPVLPPDSVQQQQPVLQSQLSMSELLNPMHSVPNGGSPAASTTTSQFVQGGVAMVAMPMTTGAGAGVQPVAYPHPTPYMVPGSMVVNQQGVPVMYPAHAPGVIYMNQAGMMGKLGGDARPVQRPPPTRELSPGPESGFGFLGKSNKGAAFDFVQDEMTQMKNK